MELSEELIEIIRELAAQSQVRNRIVVLDMFFKDKRVFKDDKYYNIYVLYRDLIRTGQAKDTLELKLKIAQKQKMTLYDVDKAMKYIDAICRSVDREVNNRYRKEYFENKRKTLVEVQNTVRRPNECATAYIKKSEVLKRQVAAIIKNYDDATQLGRVSINNLRNNIESIREKFTAVGNSAEHKLILAAMYADIGELKKCNEILNSFNIGELSKSEKDRFKKAKIKEIRAVNINFISYLFDKGYSYEEIKKRCEGQATSYRAGIIIEKNDVRVGLTPGFIKKVYDNLKENENKKDTKPKEDDEKEI